VELKGGIGKGGARWWLLKISEEDHPNGMVRAKVGQERGEWP
jgi:hypothetical protein